jgi:3-oxoacyl-[acyl-carrier protein] reductase
MDLSLHNRHAIVCASSKGLGRACAQSLAREGVHLTLCARGAEALEATAAELRAQHAVKVNAVVCDITTPEGRAAVLAACPDPDILVNNAGGPPLGDFRGFTLEDWQRALNANMLTPIELIKATVDGMIARRFGRIVNITSGTVKAPMANYDLSTASRVGLTGFAAALARQVVRHNVTVNNLLPGFFLTDRVRQVFGATAERRGVSFDEVLAERVKSIPAGHIGDAAELGDAYAYLCSAQAGFITGQNLTLDGGAYPGLF